MNLELRIVHGLEMAARHLHRQPSESCASHRHCPPTVAGLSFLDDNPLANTDLDPSVTFH